VENREIRLLALIELFDQLVEAVEYRSKILVFALDYRYSAHRSAQAMVVDAN
jgi:hypothetical protein